MVKSLPYFLIIILTCLLLNPYSTSSIKSAILGPTEANKTIYVSEDFNEEEYDLIGEAVMEWKVATHNRANFDLRFGFDHVTLNHIKNDTNSLIMVKALSKEAVVESIDHETNKTVLGYFSGELPVQRVLLVTDRLIGSSYFRAVVMHELGHALGLPHLPIRGTVMYEYMENTYHLTERDVAWFCRAYYCNPNDL